MENFENTIRNLVSTENGWYSHRKVLVEELNKLNFNNKITILEFGTGYGSAEIFHEYCKKYENIEIISFDNEQTWLSEMSSKFSSEKYKFNYTEDWINTLENLDYSKKYDLVFVDQAPWSARIDTIDFLTDKNVSVIILHDYDQYNFNDCNNCRAKIEGKYFDINEGSFFERFIDNFEMYSYYEDRLNFPPTLVLKNKKVL